MLLQTESERNRTGTPPLYGPPVTVGSSPLMLIPDNGDGGPATNAELTQPWGLAIDSADNLYIAGIGAADDLGVVRKVSTSPTQSA